MIVSAMHLAVRRVDGISIVRPQGRLDLSSYATLRDGLLKLAADEPAAIVVRLDSDFSVSTRTMFAVFTTVWMKVSEWPGVPIVLVPESARHAHELKLSGVTRFVPAYATLRSAVASVDHPPRRRRDTIDLPGSPAAPLAARTFVRRTCERWQVPWIVDDAILVASELTENAVRHARSVSVLRLELRPSVLVIAVRDTDPRPPMRARHGHGVDIVEQVSRTWGWSPSFDGGKVVWAVLTLP